MNSLIYDTSGVQQLDRTCRENGFKQVKNQRQE